MKNLYYTMALLLSGSSICLGQTLQNANWYFGERVGVTFNTTPASALAYLPNTVTFTPEEGCATISDNSGNVLFFTDGETVWQPTISGYQVIASGLYGDTSSAQNAIIVHKPGDPDNYYIFTIKGVTSDLPNRGLYYTEIEVTSTYTNVLFQNQPLKDNLGVSINSGWGNISEGLTSAKHTDNYQYWVEAFVGQLTGPGLILSYLVTDMGVINDSPASSHSFSPESFSYCIKIKDEKIAVGTAFSGGYLGAFNPANGQVSINTTPISGLSQSVYSLEFSPSGDYLYFTSDFTSDLCYIDTNSPSTIHTIPAIQIPIKLQMAIDGKMYLITGNSNIYLSSIGSPDTPTTPGITSNAIYFGSTSYHSQLGLPQLVEIQPWDGPCENEFKISATVTVPNIDTQQASNTIYCENVVESGATAIYHAGNSVVLIDGFHSESGSKFRGYILGCSSTYEGRQSSGPKFNEEIKNSLTKAAEKTIIYPNPSKGIVDIASEAIIDRLTLITVAGKIVFIAKNINAKEYTVDLEGYRNGIYILNIETDHGKIITKKLIKN